MKNPFPPRRGTGANAGKVRGSPFPGHSGPDREAWMPTFSRRLLAYGAGRRTERAWPRPSRESPQWTAAGHPRIQQRVCDGFSPSSVSRKVLKQIAFGYPGRAGASRRGALQGVACEKSQGAGGCGRNRGKGGKGLARAVRDCYRKRCHQPFCRAVFSTREGRGWRGPRGVSGGREKKNFPLDAGCGAC